MATEEAEREVTDGQQCACKPGLASYHLLWPPLVLPSSQAEKVFTFLSGQEISRECCVAREHSMNFHFQPLWEKCTRRQHHPFPYVLSVPLLCQGGADWVPCGAWPSSLWPPRENLVDPGYTTCTQLVLGFPWWLCKIWLKLTWMWMCAGMEGILVGAAVRARPRRHKKVKGLWTIRGWSGDTYSVTTEGPPMATTFRFYFAGNGEPWQNVKNKVDI